MSPSPQSQAINARLVLNNDVLSVVSSLNARLTSQYHEAVLQWVANKEQGGAPYPIPDPPMAWEARMHANSADETRYDAQYPGIPPKLDDVVGINPVLPKYVDVVIPPVTGPVIGVNIGGAWFSAGYVDGGREVQDKTPAGIEVPGTSRDGISGVFRKYAAVVGPGWWNKVG